MANRRRRPRPLRTVAAPGQGTRNRGQEGGNRRRGSGFGAGNGYRAVRFPRVSGPVAAPPECWPPARRNHVVCRARFPRSGQRKSRMFTMPVHYQGTRTKQKHETPLSPEQTSNILCLCTEGGSHVHTHSSQRRRACRPLRVRQHDWHLGWHRRWRLNRCPGSALVHQPS